jgi:spermidine synthase
VKIGDRLRFLLLLACFLLSGLAALIYETVWTQQFAVVFGTSELALATVLAAYMAGLALGAAAAARWAHRVRRPVLAYAVLELGIGAAALAVPLAIRLTSRLHVALLSGPELPSAAGSIGSALFYLVCSFAILIVPTAMMGATLPLLARWAVRRDREIGPRVGALYTANTAGAAAGTLAAAYLLLPRLGLGRTVLTAAGVNLLVFLLTVILARGREAGEGVGRLAPGHGPPSGGGAPRAPSNGTWVLPLILLSGAVSFTWEILWTRLLSHLLGGSVYAFATMLATFLVGLSLGSGLASRLALTAERARSGFALAQFAVAGLSLAAFAMLDRLPDLARRLAASGDGWLVSGTILGAATLLPGAVAVGATFPLAVRCLAADARDAARASGRVFAWNTVGAVVGALGAGYLMLPALRFAGTAAAAAALSLALALATALAVAPRRKVLGAAAIAGLAIVAIVRPATPWAVLRHGALGHGEALGEVVHYGVGRSATVLLFEQRAGWQLTTNGLPESTIGAPWARSGSLGGARWLSQLPFAVRPETRSLLVIGLGGGVMVERAPASVKRIHVVELEPEVIRANRWAASRRDRDPLADPRLELHVNDARGALRLTEQRFDAIVSQPSHPWTPGASNLFTQEFFALVRERLTPGGVFVQWMGVPFVDAALLRSLVATALAAFPHVEVYYPTTGAVFILAAREPLDVVAASARSLDVAPEEWAELGVHRREDLVAARILDEPGARRFAAGARPSTDSLNLLRSRSPGVLGRSLTHASAQRILAPYDPLRQPPEELDLAYLVRRLLRQGSVERGRLLAESLEVPLERLTATGLAALAAGRRDAAEFSLREALRIDSRDPVVLAALLTLYRPAIVRGEPVSFVRRFAADPEAALIEGWQLSGAQRWPAVRRLEERLAAVDARHPLYEPATRLRAAWRIESGERPLGHEALTLLEPLLAPVAQPVDLLLHGRAAAALGRPRAALAAVGEALPRIAAGSATMREAEKLLGSLPRNEATREWLLELEMRIPR